MSTSLYGSENSFSYEWFEINLRITKYDAIKILTYSLDFSVSGTQWDVITQFLESKISNG